jgi:hypothetical protein
VGGHRVASARARFECLSALQQATTDVSAPRLQRCCKVRTATSQWLRLRQRQQPDERPISCERARHHRHRRNADCLLHSHHRSQLPAFRCGTRSDVAHSPHSPCVRALSPSKCPAAQRALRREIELEKGRACPALSPPAVRENHVSWALAFSSRPGDSTEPGFCSTVNSALQIACSFDRKCAPSCAPSDHACPTCGVQITSKVSDKMRLVW